MTTQTHAEVVLDADVVADPDEPRATAVALTRPDPAPTVAPQVEARELGARLAVIREAMQQQMTPDVDYGVIPGTGSKPTLLKPGAEKLSVLFQLDVQLENVLTWGPGDHLTVQSRATVFHAPTGQRLGFGEGLCSTREKKYGKRRQDRVCPKCGKPAIIKGLPEYGGGWVCFKRKDGCGAKFPDGDQSIEAQTVGLVENPELPDTWNTVVKMAEKRARVDAILAVTGASALFTQDVEDTADPAVKEPVADPAPFGPGAKGASVTAAKRAVVKLLGDRPELASRVWHEMVDHFGGIMPVAAELALRKVASAMPAPAPVLDEAPPVDVPSDVPWSPDYTPTAEQLAALEDEALARWEALEGATKAARRVAKAAGNPRQLLALIDAALMAGSKAPAGEEQS